MGVYSWVVFAATSVFALLVCSLCPGRLHAWVFWTQMLGQTSCHLFIQYREAYLHEVVSIRSVGPFLASVWNPRLSVCLSVCVSGGDTVVIQMLQLNSQQI